MKLTNEQQSVFKDEGYLLVEDLFSDADLQPVIDEISEEIDRRSRELVSTGDLSREYSEEGFETRLTRITAETQKLYWGICSGQLSGKAIFGLLTHPSLLDLAESLLGPEMIASSAYRLRPKVPVFFHGVVPWHQDSGYFEPFCDRALILTVWIPLVDATRERGCLQVMPRVHRSNVFRHGSDATGHYLEIAPDDLPSAEIISVPVCKGGALLLTNRTPHRSTDNLTDVVRWSMDFRYQAADLPTNFRGAGGAPFHTPAENEPVACYPPEADLLVRSRERPVDVVSDWRRFVTLRQKHVPAPLTARWR
ncbi:MAG TPA: phytanoyl-CoA dioxygenase family protein [Armatimonadota bacterium]|nr:phytanoyl-CoA dioxygenase family protein [Armatimonadota bacterium]